MNIVVIEDNPQKVEDLRRRIESELAHDCLVFESVTAAQSFVTECGSDLLCVILSQRLSPQSYSPYGHVPTIVVSDGLPVESSVLLRSENVLDYVLNYSSHNHSHIIALLRRAEFQGQGKIMVVANEAISRNLFSNLLKKNGYQVLQAKHGKEALELLQNHPEVRLILTDMDMPQMNGAQLIAAVREKQSKQELPIIGLASDDADGEALQFLRLGANDVLTKPPRALHEVQVRVMQNLALAEAFHEISELSRKDFLTGLFNRRHFGETAEKLFAQMKRGRLCIALAMIDIDNFKHVNDAYGHAAGDLAIADTARILKANLRDTDVIARFGGEEFCILLAGLESIGDAELVMNRMVAKIAEHTMRFDAHEFSITISCGLCQESKSSLEEMIQESDRLLYQAKTTGKNRVVTNGSTSSQ